MSSNDTIAPSAGGPFSDWVEIVSYADVVQDISHWGLSDNLNWPRKWQFPQGTSIWPGEHKVIHLSKSKTPGSDASALHASFAVKRAGGEVMTLSDWRWAECWTGLSHQRYPPIFPTAAPRERRLFFRTYLPPAPPILLVFWLCANASLSTAGGLYNRTSRLKSPSPRAGDPIPWTVPSRQSRTAACMKAPFPSQTQPWCVPAGLEKGCSPPRYHLHLCDEDLFHPCRLSA